jgi:D-glycero-alpha-D-manno-heptose-7-phosphate kinase
VSNPFIDTCYEMALLEGAWGGKITGAGGGGFLLFCCPEDRQKSVIKALESQGLIQMSFSLDFSGARVLMNSGLRFTSRFSWTPPDKLLQRI